MAEVLSADTLEASFVKFVNAEAEKLREQAIQNAVGAFEKSLREAVMKQAVNLTSFYDISRDGSTVTLTVRHSDDNQYRRR